MFLAGSSRVRGCRNKASSFASPRLSQVVEVLFDPRTPAPDTPLELRSGRRLPRLPFTMQQETTLGSTSTAPPSWTITSRQRDPQVFAGLRGEDVEDWIDNYNRVSSYNRWDDSLKLLNVVFYLADVAKTWFLNHEDTLTDWTCFTNQLRQIFGTASTRSETAKKKLNERVQHPDETYTSYIEDVLALCRRVSASMSEEERVRHILKGIAPFAFQALVVQNTSRVQDVITTCQRIDELQSLRLQPAMWGERFPKDVDLRAMIRSIVREELHGHTSQNLPGTHHQPLSTTMQAAVPRESFVPGLRDLVKEELAAITCASPYKAEPSYVPAAPPVSPVPHVAHTSTTLPHTEPPTPTWLPFQW